MLPLPELDKLALDAIIDFIRSKVDESGANGVCLGLSGGIDSALVATLSVKALGPDLVHALILPESATPDEDIKDAELLAQSLGINHIMYDITWNVENVVERFPLTDVPTIATANLKARMRMLLIYYTANSKNLLVAGTSNKTEILLGYFTKYGDGASDIAPIGDLYKTQVRKLSRQLGVPNSIITKEPTAGLIEGQKDRDELGYDYDTIDRVLFALERGLKPEYIAEEMALSMEDILSIKRRVVRNSHKRRSLKIPKMGISTVSTDLREYI